MIKAIPKEIVEKMEQTNQLISEVETWLNENIDLDRGDEHFVDLDNGGNPFPYFTIVDKPKGKLQSNGWWVDSHQQGVIMEIKVMDLDAYLSQKDVLF